MTEQELLKYKMNYCRDTGVFVWKNSIPRLNNKVAGSKNSMGYIMIFFKGKQRLAHRLAWLYEYGKFPSGDMDHINHIKSDNRLSNLRIVTHQENHKNQKLRGNNSSGVTGVYFNKKKKVWVANICVDGNTKYLGQSKDKNVAISIRKNAELEYRFHENHGTVYLEKENNDI